MSLLDKFDELKEKYFVRKEKMKEPECVSNIREYALFVIGEYEGHFPLTQNRIERILYIIDREYFKKYGKKIVCDNWLDTVGYLSNDDLDTLLVDEDAVNLIDGVTPKGDKYKYVEPKDFSICEECLIPDKDFIVKKLREIENLPWDELKNLSRVD